MMKRKLRNCARCEVRHGPPTGKNEKLEEGFEGKNSEMGDFEECAEEREQSGSETVGEAITLESDRKEVGQQSGLQFCEEVLQRFR